MKLSVATCHFPVDADIRRNEQYVVSQMRVARALGADVAHFPEAGLSGYAGTDFRSYRGFDWPRLEAATRHVLDVAGQIGLWVVLGSTHRLTGRHKPHDSMYIINDQGRIVDRYDKMFCSGPDLTHYSPGTYFATFSLKGILCGVQYAFPELYREYKRRRVQLVFHSFHAGHASPKRVKVMASEVGAKFHKFERRLELSGDQDACIDAGGRHGESSLGQLQQHLGTTQLFPELFRSRGWHHHGPSAAKRRRRVGVIRGHERAALRRNSWLAGSGDARDIPQWHACARQAVGRSDSIVRAA